MQGPSTVLSRSESITSNGDCSMSSGIVSEVDEENGFDVDFPDGKILYLFSTNSLIINLTMTI